MTASSFFTPRRISSMTSIHSCSICSTSRANIHRQGIVANRRIQGRRRQRPRCRRSGGLQQVRRHRSERPQRPPASGRDRRQPLSRSRPPVIQLNIRDISERVQAERDRQAMLVNEQSCALRPRPPTAPRTRFSLRCRMNCARHSPPFSAGRSFSARAR